MLNPQQPDPHQHGVYESSLRDLLYVVFRHKKKILFTFLLISVGVAFRAYRAPDLFRSEAKVLVKVGRSVSVDPAVVGPMVSIGQSRKEEVNSELVIMRSVSIVEKAVDTLGAAQLFRDLNGIAASEGRSIDARWEGRRNREALMRAAVVNHVVKNLDLSVPKESNVVEIGFKTIDPALAQRVLNAFLDAYVERHIAVHSAQASPDFFQSELERIRSTLDASEESLWSFMKEKGIVSIEGQKKQLLDRQDGLQCLIGEEDSSIQATSATIRVLEAALKKLPRSVELSRTTGLRSDKKEEMRNRLVELRLKEAELGKRYQPEARVLTDVRDQIRLLENTFMKEPATNTAVTYGLNEKRVALERSLTDAKSVLEGLEAKRAVQIREMNEVGDELLALQAHEAAMVRLQREVTIREKEYFQYQDNLQRSAISAALDRDKVSNVSIVQRATLTETPVGLNRRRKAILGVFFGIVGGLALAFLREFFDSSFKTKDEVERRIGVPALTVSRAGFSCERAKSASASSEMARVMTSLSQTIESACPGTTRRVVAFLGAHRGEGAPVLAREFAKTVSERLGKTVLLLDANSGGEGREELPEGQAARGWQDAILAPSLLDQVIVRQDESNLYFGRLSSDNSAPVFGLPGIDDFFAALRERFDLVVVDLPSADASSDGIALSIRTDGIVLVVESERTRWQAAASLKNYIVQQGGRVLCAILNKRRDVIPDFVYKRI